MFLTIQKWSSPLLIVTATATLWLAHERARMALEYKSLRTTMNWVTESSKQQAQEAFDQGSFREAEALLEPASLGGNDDKDLQFLHARALECVGRFAEAAEAYERIGGHPGAPKVAERSWMFCMRMASERNHTSIPSRESLYRLHDELMHRHQCTSARYIARQLLPDTEPLRASVLALLKAEDEEATILPSKETGRLDVTVSKPTRNVMDLLRDLPIQILAITSAKLQDSTLLDGLDVHDLRINFNPLSDIAALRSLPLKRLDLSDTQVTDVRVLASLPLKELNLSHTNVSFLLPLSICPLEKLNLAGLPIHSIQDLRTLALRQLNLAHTKVVDLSPLASLPLEELHLDGTMVRDLKPLAGSHLKHLTLTHTPVTDLSPLSGLPLEDLDLRGCELLSDIDSLSGCPQLEKIGLPHHLAAPANLGSFPRLKFVERDEVWTPESVNRKSSQLLVEIR